MNKPVKADQDTILDEFDTLKPRFTNVIAGPGSGKSTLISRMILAYLDEGGRMEDIACLSFTNESWKELFDKIQSLLNLKDNFSSLTITTFHKFAAELTECRDAAKEQEEETLKAGFAEDKNPVYDQMIKNAINSLEEYTQGTCYDGIDRDLLRRLKIIFIDEAQDLKEDTYDLIRRLMHARPDLKIVTVSDPDQGIFTYNGSDSQYIVKLMKYDPSKDPDAKDSLNDDILEDIKQYYLTVNYRSCKKIVDYTEEYRIHILSDSPRKERMETKSEDDSEEYVNTDIKKIKVKPDNFCDAIINKISQKVAEEKESHNYSIGVIVPRNEDVLSIYRVLYSKYRDDKNVRVTTTGLHNSFSLARLDEFHALFRYIDEAFVRCPYNHYAYFKSSSKGVSRFKSRCKNKDTINMDRNAWDNYDLENCKRRFKESYKDRKYTEAVIQELEFYLDNYIDKNDCPGFLNDKQYKSFKRYISLQTFDEFYNKHFEAPDDDARIEIKITTIHKAKGKEFDCVLMSCIEQGNEWLNEKDPYAIDKCRYVAMTRAKYELLIFNDEEKEYYTDSFDEYMTDSACNIDSIDYSIILGPRDLILSFSEKYFDRPAYTQFIPNETIIIKSDDHLASDREIPVYFPDTPEKLKIGQRLNLVNYISSYGKNRFIFEVDNCGGLAVERLSDEIESERHPLHFLAEGFNRIKEKYCSDMNYELKDIYYNHYDHHRKRHNDINEIFREWYEKKIDISIGAIMIINNVYAPWVKGTDYQIELIQHPDFSYKGIDYEGYKLLESTIKDFYFAKYYYLDLYDMNHYDSYSYRMDKISLYKKRTERKNSLREYYASKVSDEAIKEGENGYIRNPVGIDDELYCKKLILPMITFKS